MVIDIVIGVIVIFSMVQGFRNGFVFTLIHTIGWALSLVIGFAAAPYVNTFLRERTGLYRLLYKNLDEKFTETIGNADLSFDSLPTIISEKLDTLAGNIADAMAVSLADVLFSIICFIFVILVAKLALWMIMDLFSKRKNDGFSSSLDGIFGLIFGFLKSMILVFVLLAILVPVLSLIGGDLSETVIKTLDDSYLAKDLYDNNLILLIVRDFLS